MNLDDMLKEAAIVDHSWYNGDVGLSGVKVDIEDRMHEPNNAKPELEVQWDNPGPQIDIEGENIVERNIPAEMPGPKVVKFARDLMNSGMMGDELVAALKDRFDASTMEAEKDELAAQLRLQGFVGCVALDGRGYKSCKEAMEVAKNSPYKASLKYVLGCACGDTVDIPDAGEGMVLAETSGNSMDDFMASDGDYKPLNVVCCRSTMLPVIAAQSDIDESYMAPDVMDLMNVTGLPEGDLEKIQSSDRTASEKVKEVFRAAYRARKTAKEEKYAEKVDASEHRLQMADNEIELAAEAGGQIDLEAEVAEMTVESSDFSGIDVDMGVELGGIFEGSDEVLVDEQRQANADLDIDIRPDMII